MPKPLKNLPTFEKERTLLQQGFKAIAGVDESGKSSIVGPIIAAAVVFPLPNSQDPDFEQQLSALTQVLQVRDSKRLSKYSILEKVYKLILSVDPIFGIGVVTLEELNLLKNDEKAAIRASQRAFSALTGQITPDFVLFDNGLDFADSTLPPHQSLVKGDATSLTIAAASVIAKYTFDTWMIAQSEIFHGYNFENNKGYPTDGHIAKLNELGPTSIHRSYHKYVKAARSLMLRNQNTETNSE